jgi:hypothetical protein
MSVPVYTDVVMIHESVRVDPGFDDPEFISPELVEIEVMNPVSCARNSHE